MAGTKAGGLLAAATNKARYGEDFYRKIGTAGGRKGHTGGFYTWKQAGRDDLIAAAGAKGGRISRRVKMLNIMDVKHNIGDSV